MLATSCGPPHVSSSWRHCAVVLESIQTGEWGTEKQLCGEKGKVNMEDREGALLQLSVYVFNVRRYTKVETEII